MGACCWRYGIDWDIVAVALQWSEIVRLLIRICWLIQVATEVEYSLTVLGAALGDRRRSRIVYFVKIEPG